MVKSGLFPNTEYDQARARYISNMKQAYLYLRNGATLIDLLYFDTKNDSLVFVFKQDDNLRELYELWNKHELN